MNKNLSKKRIRTIDNDNDNDNVHKKMYKNHDEKYIIHIEHDNSDYISNPLKAFDNLITDIKLHITKDGIRIFEPDNGSIAAIKFEISSKAFSRYDITRNITLDIHLQSFIKILSCMKHENISIIVKENDPQNYYIMMKGCAFKLHQLNIESESLGMPSFDGHITSVSITSSDYQDICNKISKIADSYTSIRIIDGNIIFKAHGTLGEVSIIKENIDISSNVSYENSFSTKYLNIFAKAAALSEEVTLKFAKDSPIELNMSYDKGLCTISYFLAPQSEEEDE